MREIYKNLDPKWTQYPNDVLSGNVVAGRYIKLACKRYLSWFDRTDIIFVEERMKKTVELIGHMKHFEGSFSGKSFILLDYQIWLLCSIFGFVHCDPVTGEPTEKRVVEDVVLFLARKNAKTALSSVILLSDMILSHINYYQGYLVSNTREQARIALKFVQGYAKSIDSQLKKKRFKNYVNWLKYAPTEGSIKCLSSEAGVNDGLRPDSCILDEYHAATTSDMENVIKSGMGASANPLFIIISSGGYNLHGPFHEKIQVAHRRLTGQYEYPDNIFYALYELDQDDQWDDPNVWQKANPSLLPKEQGGIVSMDFLKKRLQESRVNMSTQVDFQIKNLDLFVSSSNIWLPEQSLDMVCVGTKDIDYEALRDSPCYAGCDLSSVSDLTSICLCWPPDPYREWEKEKYIFKTFNWVPAQAIESSSNGPLYEQWIHSKLSDGTQILKVTAGNCVDYTQILLDLQSWCTRFNICKFLYDEWNSTAFIQQLQALGIIPCVEPMSQSIGSFSRGTKTLEILIQNQQCLIDSNQLLRWAFSHCELRYDSFQNCKPIKAMDNKNNKIDPIIAMIQALSGYLFEQLFAQDMQVITLDL